MNTVKRTAIFKKENLRKRELNTPNWSAVDVPPLVILK